MALTHFCSSCSAKVTYEAVLPNACPRCTKPLRTASSILSAPPPRVAPTPRPAPEVAYDDNGDPQDDLPFRQPVYSQRSKPVVRKERPTHRAAAKVYADEEDGDRDVGGSEVYDRAEARRLAAEMAAAFEGDGIQLNPFNGVHETVTFGALWQQGKAEREKGGS